MSEEFEIANVVVLKYSIHKRVLAVFTYLLIASFGIFCIYLNMWLTIIIGILIFISSTIHLLDVLLFKELIIGDEFLTKKWYLFGNKKVELSNLYIFCSNRVWKNKILFYPTNGSKVSRFCMNIESYLVAKNKFEDIKNVLISKGLITGEEKCWNMKKRVNLLKRMIEKTK